MSGALAHRDPDTPVLHGTLGAILHLEMLDAADEDALDRACERLWAWIGPHLTFANLSCADSTETIRRTHLEYVPSYVTALTAPAAPRPEEQLMHNRMTAHGRTDFFLLCSGADDPAKSSPHSIRFWAEMGIPPDQERDLPAYGVLHFTVPETTPLDEFQREVVAVAAELRLRWGAAGYTYSGLDLAPGRHAEEAQFAHARRYPGYDLPAYVQVVTPFYRQIRSVSWLTFLGPAMTGELRDLGQPLESQGEVQVFPTHDGGVLLRAGAAPDRGDVNRLWFPTAYREADAMVRPIRSEGRDVWFFHPWDETSTRDWLRRFERQVT
ncbi:MAG: DUF3396 domain-containing protein [Polyangiaceae bacterium]